MGLLDEYLKPRDCLRGHGQMSRQSGLWVLQQVERAPGSGSGDLTITGKLLTANVYVCQICGFVELVDERNQ